MTKTALITGGSGGIGRATAELLKEHAWTVVAPDHNVMDILNLDAARLYAYAWQSHPAKPSLDALVMCAGKWYSEPIGKSVARGYKTIEQCRMVAGHQVLLEEFLPALESSRGCVVAVASTRAFIGGVDCAPYAIAKAGLVALIQGFAREYKGQVRFNVVAPGLIDTVMGQQVIASGGARSDAIAQPASAVAQAILDLIFDGQSNGRIVRVVDSTMSDARWTWNES